MKFEIRYGGVGVGLKWMKRIAFLTERCVRGNVSRRNWNGREQEGE